MKILYFTGTGNSLAVAKRIGGELISIPQEMRKEELTYKDDVIGLVFPVYYGSVPKIVREFLKKAKIQADYLFAVATCGSGDGAVLYDLETITQEKDIQFEYMNSVVMVDNFLPVFEVESEINKLPKKNTENVISQIVLDISNRRSFKPSFSLKTKAFSKMAKIIQEKSQGYSSKSFTVNENCTLCGTCEKVCPAANVSVLDKVTFSDQCESCYACVHACPMNAIHLKKEKSDKRFRNPDVSLQEIIESNNQR